MKNELFPMNRAPGFHVTRLDTMVEYGLEHRIRAWKGCLNFESAAWTAVRASYENAMTRIAGASRYFMAGGNVRTLGYKELRILVRKGDKSSL